MKILILSLLFLSSSAFAESAAQSLSWSGDYFGVETSTFQSFFQSLSSPPGADSASTCLSGYTAPFDQSKRNRLLNCLSSRRATLDEQLFSSLFETNSALRLEVLTNDIEKTILLNEYLMDLTRQRIAEVKMVDWYFKDQKKFLQIQNSEGLPLQSGDMLLNFGGAGTSGLITRTASPAFRASHGVILKKEGQKLYVLESLPHLGARKNIFADYLGDKNFHATVLRWKNLSERPLLAKKSTALAEKWTDMHIPFDSDFSSLSENKKMYCTLMTGLAYARSAHKEIEEMYPESKNTISPAGAKLTEELIGMNQKNYITAASLLRSPFFEIVAEYRDSKNLYQSWQIDMLTDLMIQKTQMGYQIKPFWFYSYVHWLYNIPLLNRIPILAKAKTLAGLIGQDRFAKLATYEKKIIEKALAKTNLALKSVNMLKVPPWEMRNALSIELNAITQEQMELSSERSFSSSAKRQTERVL
jgi:hypothetical protein